MPLCGAEGKTACGLESVECEIEEHIAIARNVQRNEAKSKQAVLLVQVQWLFKAAKLVTVNLL